MVDEVSDIPALLDGYRQGLWTVEAVMRRVLCRIEAKEAMLNALSFRVEDEALLDAARRMDVEGYKEGLMLWGVPIIIKESVDLKGSPITAAWPPLKNAAHSLFPPDDAEVVKRLKESGALIIGKGNVPQWCNSGTHADDSAFGPTLNGRNPAVVAGGSSSGVASSVAAHYVFAGLAEETGGSIQNPASAQGLSGIKTTFGLVPTQGCIPLAGSTRDVLGPIARSVRDCAIFLDVLTGKKEPYYSTSCKDNQPLVGKRLGLYGPGWSRTHICSEETLLLYDEAKKLLAGLGAILVNDPFAGTSFADLAHPGPYDARGTESVAYDLEEYFSSRVGLSLAEFPAKFGGASPFAKGETLREEYFPLLPALEASVENPRVRPDLSEFLALKQQYLDLFQRVMTEHRLDALVFPQSRSAHPNRCSHDDPITSTTVGPLNISGLPGVVVPAGTYQSNDSPFCLIFIGGPLQESLLIGLAHDFQTRKCGTSDKDCRQ